MMVMKKSFGNVESGKVSLLMVAQVTVEVFVVVSSVRLYLYIYFIHYLLKIHEITVVRNKVEVARNSLTCEKLSCSCKKQRSKLQETKTVARKTNCDLRETSNL